MVGGEGGYNLTPEVYHSFKLYSFFKKPKVKQANNAYTSIYDL